RNPDALLEYIDGKMTDSQMYYILLDEVQHVNEFEDVLNSYLKVKNADVYVTGSNSKFLSKDVITEFRGRGEEIKVSPLCFREFMSVYNGSREQALEEYMTYGGLPQIVTLSDETKKMEYLNSLFEKVYLTDIKERYKIRNDSDLEELIDVSLHRWRIDYPQKLRIHLRRSSIKISYNTIKKYLDILQDVFLLEKSVRYDVKGRKYCYAGKILFL
ncbi:MAG: ATP-binding protein, partial [Butyricimonas faecihominis]